jgi:hypothetical protein
VLAVVAEAFEVEVFDIQRSCCVARAARQLLSMQFLLLFLFHLSGIFKTNLLCEELSPGKAEYLQTRIRRARARAHPLTMYVQNTCNTSNPESITLNK